MITRTELRKYRKAELAGCNLSDLADLRTISINRNQALDERVENFVKRTGNPYLFRVDDTAVKVEFIGTKPFSQVLPKCFAIGR